MKTSTDRPRAVAVSIVIPVFNKAALARQCLTALNSTTRHIPHEVIVVDDASTDDTRQCVQTCPGSVTLTSNDTPVGFARACNQGAAVAKGKYTVFLSPTAIPLPGWLDALVHEVNSHTSVAAVGSRLVYNNGLIHHAGIAFFRESRMPYNPYQLLTAEDPRVNRRRQLQAVSALCMLIRPQWFRECGGFSKEWTGKECAPSCEDLDLCLNIRRRSGVIVYQPRSTLVVQPHPSAGRSEQIRRDESLFLSRWQEWILADEDAYYLEDGYRMSYRNERGTYGAKLVRIASEAEREAWSVVAQFQVAAAEGKSGEMRELLKRHADWPQDAAIHRWAGVLCYRMGLPQTGQAHLQASLLLEDSEDLRLELARLTSRSDELRNLGSHFTGEARIQFRGIAALKSSDAPLAELAFDEALLQGACPCAVLLGKAAAALQGKHWDEARKCCLAVLASERTNSLAIQYLKELEAEVLRNNVQIPTEVGFATPTTHPSAADTTSCKTSPTAGAALVCSPRALLKVGFLSLERHDAAVPFLRLKSVLDYLHKTGTVEHISLGAASSYGKVKIHEANLKHADVVVVQREMAGTLPYDELKKKIEGRQTKIVFELDDALTQLPPWHKHLPFFRGIQPQIEEYLRRADLVTVSTQNLRTLYRSFNSNIVVLPNSLDARVWVPSRVSSEESGKVAILFTGTFVHEHDLLAIEAALLDLMAAYPNEVEFHFWFWGNLPERLRSAPQVKLVHAFSPDYGEYARLLRKLPVRFAIVPLMDTAFNLAKSAIKWLEYSVCRIPGIYSDVPVYSEVVESGRTGLLVPNTREAWFSAMKSLIENPTLRRQLAEQAQQAVLVQHTVEHNARLWADAYQALIAPPVPQATVAAALAPAVSIVIPAFNKLELTRLCLLAVQKNTPEGQFEIIVVDNGSTDGTGDFLKVEEAEDRLRTVVNAENLGFAQACNQGVQAARGEYVLFLNNDTEVQAGWLDPLISLADEDANIAAVGSKLVFPDGTLQHAGVAIGEVIGRDPLLAVHTFYKASADLPEANQRRVYQALTAACLLVRKSAFEAVGGFDEGFWNGYEDVDLCLRLQEKGWLMVYEPASVVIHHESQSGPARFQKVQENIRRLHEKWLGKAKLDVSVAADGAVSPAGTTRIRPYVPGAVGAADISIVILTHNQLAHTKACLESIAQHTPEPHELILVDNGSTDGTQDYLREYAAQRERVFVVANRTNRGFAAGNNQGLALATGRQVLFLNNDTVVTPGWLGNMLRVLQEHPQTGVVGPRSNRVLGKQQVDDVGYKSLDDLPAFAVAWAEKQAGQSRVANRAVGFCLLARREVIEAVGGLDERFGSGNFEDDDFCIRAHLAGFETRIADEAFVHHVGNATFTGAGIDYAKAMQTNWGLFKSKWAIPPETPPFPGYLTPDVAPPGVALKVPLPELKLTHQPSADGRCWMDKLMAAAKAKPIILPPCALVGNLREARQFFEQKKLPAAWGATRAALKHRPFHPEAYLLLAEIALAAQASVAARDCAQFARQLAPEFRPAKKFLKGKIYGNAKPDWLVLPEEIGKHKSEGRHHLSVCLIVKNEERFLGRCLASVKGLAHQIVVVDTGSTDRTVEIAREHGAQVHAFAWCDDFSAARNAALEHATGDWVLMLDADEDLPTEQQAALRKLLRATEVIAWRLPLQDVGSEAEGCNYVPRLFRNAPGVFYVGRVHEQVFASIEVRRQEWGLETRLGDATLRHYGYTKELTLERDKVGRNLRLLEQAILEMPGETNLLMNYGLELTRSGRPAEGLAQYRAAFTAMAALPPAVVVPETREMLLSQFCTQLMAAKRYAEIVQGLTSPLAKLGGGLTASLHFTLGLAQMELKEFAAAAEQFRQCLAKRDRPALTPVNLEIRKAGPRHCLALCLEQMGETDAAAEEFRLALETEPLAWPVRHDYARFLATHDRQIEALNLFFVLAGEKPGEPQVWLQGGQLALTRPEFLEVALDWTAEAERHLPDDPAVVQQRAEALMLAGQCSMALPLWRRWPSGSNPALAAALVLCETVAGENQFSPAPAAEVAVSREFVNWYQRLLRFNAQPTVEALNARVEGLQRVLPSAAGILTSALAEASAEIST